MRILFAVPLLMLGACQVTKDDNSTTVSFNQDVAENAAADAGNFASTSTGSKILTRSPAHSLPESGLAVTATMALSPSLSKASHLPTRSLRYVAPLIISKVTDAGPAMCRTTISFTGMQLGAADVT